MYLLRKSTSFQYLFLDMEKKILEALNMQLMDVDAQVKSKYTAILAASDEEKREKEQKEVISLSPEFHIIHIRNRSFIMIIYKYFPFTAVKLKGSQ